MKATVLMEGGWVTCKKWRENPFKLTRINDNGKYYYGITSNGTQVGPFLLEEIEPIPLTPEILEKNGFKKCDGNEWFIFKYEDDDYTKGALYQILWSADASYLEIASYTSRTGEFKRLGVKFVNELQHAMCICGIEKDIEL